MDEHKRMTEKINLTQVCPDCGSRTEGNECPACGATWHEGDSPKNDDVPAYTFRGQTISKRMMEAIRLYVEDGVRPGPFLTAIICNDLADAFARADDDNHPNIHAFVAYFYNEVPGACWGSEDKMKMWMAMGGMEGFKKGLEDKK